MRNRPKGKDDNLTPWPADRQAWQVVRLPAEPPPFKGPPAQVRRLLYQLFESFEKPMEVGRAVLLETIRRHMRKTEDPLRYDTLPEFLDTLPRPRPEPGGAALQEARDGIRDRFRDALREDLNTLLQILPACGIPFDATVTAAAAGDVDAQIHVLDTLTTWDDLGRIDATTATGLTAAEAWRFMQSDEQLAARYCPDDSPRYQRLRPVVAALAGFMRYRVDPEKYPPPPTLPPMAEAGEALTAADFPLHTSQEWDALGRAAADGRSGRNYTKQGSAIVHRVQGLPHYVRVSLTPEEEAAETSLARLESLVGTQDADCFFALLYVAGMLAPPAPLPLHTTAAAWVDLDDVAQKTCADITKMNAEERQAIRDRVYDYIRFGARACVVGQRSVPYRDKSTGKEIPTRIESPLWAITAIQRPEQTSLFGETPRRVEVAVSRQWLGLITSPDTVQYLPLGELLGGIPPGKATGAWARVLGLALANHWRRDPRGALAGSMPPVTRRELLERYTARVGDYRELLEIGQPNRLVDYWRGAVDHLAERGFLERKGEAAKGTEYRVLDSEGKPVRQGWANTWLDTVVTFYPGPAIAGAVRAVADSRFEPRPQNLIAPAAGKRRGRPRKRPAE